MKMDETLRGIRRGRLEQFVEAERTTYRAWSDHDAARRGRRRSGALAARAVQAAALADRDDCLGRESGGYSGIHGLDPDILVIGKPIAGGVASSAWGFTDAIANHWDRIRRNKPPGHSGFGTMLSANAPELEPAIHLGLLNRGCLITPFHNMMLVSPVTTAAQVGQLLRAFDEVTGALVS
jgi:glutamate-1-semialdehyde aminotransferase